MISHFKEVGSTIVIVASSSSSSHCNTCGNPMGSTMVIVLCLQGHHFIAILAAMRLDLPWWSSQGHHFIEILAVTINYQAAVYQILVPNVDKQCAKYLYPMQIQTQTFKQPNKLKNLKVAKLISPDSGSDHHLVHFWQQGVSSECFSNTASLIQTISPIPAISHTHH